MKFEMSRQKVLRPQCTLADMHATHYEVALVVCYLAGCNCCHFLSYRDLTQLSNLYFQALAWRPYQPHTPLAASTKHVINIPTGSGQTSY